MKALVRVQVVDILSTSTTIEYLPVEYEYF